MSWFKRESESTNLATALIERECGREACRTEGFVDQVRGLAGVIWKANCWPTERLPPNARPTSRWARASASISSRPGYELVDGGLAPLIASLTDIKPYKARLRAAQEAYRPRRRHSQRGGSSPSGRAQRHGYSLLGGSMGAVVGETIARAVDRGAPHPQAAHHHSCLRRERA